MTAMSTDSQGSVTGWIGELAGGEADEAARRLWERYFDQLVRVARDRLRAAPRGPADEEDAALSAFDSFCRGVAAGRFPRLAGRDDLWRLLVTITARKASDLREREARQKRGGGRLVRESELGSPRAEDEAGGLDQFVGAAPTPEFLALMTEEVRRLFDLLPNESLRLVALLKMEGYTVDEVATRLDRSARSVQRKLELIRMLWMQEGAP
jgi:DNA-directed RNA polymerase specialized sigma24 family protein